MNPNTIGISILSVLYALSCIGFVQFGWSADSAVQKEPTDPTEMVIVSTAASTEDIQEAETTVEKEKKKKKSSKKKTEKKQVEKETKEVEESNDEASNDSFKYSAGYFMQMGELYDDEWRYTWYSENVLPGGGLDIPGRHLDDEGYVVDENGYLTLASEDLEYGTVINVPFGSGVGVVRDCGCPNGTIDIYVGW